MKKWREWKPSQSKQDSWISSRMPPPSYEELKHEVEKAELLNNQFIQKLLETYRALEPLRENRVRRKQKQHIANKIRAKVHQHTRFPFQKNESPTQPLESNILLGTSYTGSTYYYNEKHLVQHLLIAASSGSGKTNTVYEILEDLSVPYWNFDLKHDYRHLIQDKPEIIVIPAEKIRFNPLKPPPLVDTNTWSKEFVKIFCDVTDLLSGSKNWMTPHVEQVYRNHDTPTLQDLYNRIQRQSPPPGVERQYYDRVKSRLRSILTGKSREIFQHPDGFNYEKLLNHPVVFEIKELDRNAQNLITGGMLQWLYSHHRTKYPQDSQLRHAVIVDECKKIWNNQKEQQAAAPRSHSDKILEEIRGFGVGLIAADQEPLKLSKTLLTNTKTKILLATYDHDQLKEISDSLGLNQYQRLASQNLRTGDAIIQVGNQTPSAIAVHEYQLDKDVTDDQVLNHFRNHPVLEDEQVLFQPQETDETTSESTSKSREQVEELEQGDTELSDNADLLLKQLADEPFKSITQHYDDHFDSRTAGVDAKNELLAKNYIEEQKAKLESGKRNLYNFTEKAVEQLEQRGTELEIDGKGGIVHKYWQHRIQDWFEKHGWTAKLETFDADVYANSGDTESIVEVAMGKNQREIEHIEKHLKKDFDHIITGCASKQIQNYLTEKLEDNSLDSDSVEVMGVQQLQSRIADL